MKKIASVRFLLDILVFFVVQFPEDITVPVNAYPQRYKQNEPDEEDDPKDLLLLFLVPLRSGFLLDLAIERAAP